MEYAAGNYVEYEYDPLYRLKTETRKDNGGNQQAKYEFEYDLAGNRLSQSRYTSSATWEKYHTYEYNDANQLTYENQYDEDTMNVHLKGTQYVYNDLGNLVEKNIDTNPGDGLQYTDEYWDYGYDGYNRLINVDKNSNNIADYTFNMLGSRVKKYVYSSAEATKMLYDGYDCVADYNSGDTLQRYYVTPMLDENLLVYDEADTDAEYFYLHDGLGTVRQILDDTQNVENQYDYEGFGTSLSSTENIYNRFRYTGREIDIETESSAGAGDGLYYYRARTYDSSAGSFTSRDPIPASNLYSYCSNNPITYTDPHGQKFYFARGWTSIWNSYAKDPAMVKVLEEVWEKSSSKEVKINLRDHHGNLDVEANEEVKYKGFGSLAYNKSDVHKSDEILDTIRYLSYGDVFWYYGHGKLDEVPEDECTITTCDNLGKDDPIDKDKLAEAASKMQGGLVILAACNSNNLVDEFENADILITFKGECNVRILNHILNRFWGELLKGKIFQEAYDAATGLAEYCKMGCTMEMDIKKDDDD